MRASANVVGAVILGTLLIPSAAGAQGAGTSGGIVLNEGAGVRASAMGNAATAMPGDTFGIFANPGVMGFLQEGRMALSYRKGVVNDSLGAFSVSIPAQQSTLSAGLVYYNVGDIDLIYADGNEVTVNAKTDMIGIVSYALRLGGWAVGGSAKYLSSRLVGEIDASTLTYDAGLAAEIGRHFMMGAAVQNIGGEMRYIDTGDKIGMLMRGGFAWQAVPETLILAADVLKPADEDIKEHLGFEYRVNSDIAVRGGYKLGYDVENFSIGFGIIQKNYSFDYAWVPSGELGDKHFVSLNMKLGIKRSGAKNGTSSPNRSSWYNKR